MGKGGSSKSSTQNSNTNINGTNAVEGDNLGVLISGVQGSVGNITLTDQGAIKAAADTAKAAINSNTEVTSGALKSNTDVSKSAMDAVKSMAAQSNENARAAITMASTAKTYEQTGNASVVKGIAYAVCVVAAVGVVAYAVKEMNS